jgi:arylsulfatase
MFISSPSSSLPHILLLVTDQFRFDAFSPEITPNLYHYLKNATFFENAYSSTPTCTPARAALLTGKSPWAHGMLGYASTTNCPKYPTTLPRMLGELLNYTTVAIGKNHYGPIKHIQGYQEEWIYDGLSSYEDDYDEWFRQRYSSKSSPPPLCNQTSWNTWKAQAYCYDTYEHPTEWTTRQALEYLRNYTTATDHNHHNPKSPLFLKVSYHRPHSPYDPPQEIWNDFQGNGSKSKLPQLQRRVNDSSWDREYKHYNMYNDPQAHAGDPGKNQSRRSRSAYLANIALVDRGMGEIFEFLRHHSPNNFEFDNNVLIIWTADHGDMNGDHYLWRKGYPWEGSSHVPLLVKLPQRILMLARQQEGGSLPPVRPLPPAATSSSSKALVELRDVAVTIYDALGILPQVRARDPLLDGKSLLPVLLHPQNSSTARRFRQVLDLEHDRLYGDFYWNALVGYYYSDDENEDDDGNDGDVLYKYIFNAMDGREQLFCLTDDPHEWYDLAAETVGINSTHDDLSSNPTSILLAKWRQRMVDQFMREGRGEKWVKGGILQRREESILFGPNYPCQGEEKKNANNGADSALKSATVVNQ